MVGHRVARVNEALKEEIGQIIQEDLKDPRIEFVTVTSVDVSKDLRYATVFLSVLGNDEAKKECLAGLKSAKGYIRSELGKRIRMKFLPDLRFKIDEAIDEGLRISKLIKQARRKEKNGENS